MNRYSLNVYQVVCLVIGLCCVWCSSDRKSDKMWLFGIFKRILLNLDSQVESVSAEITNAIKELRILSENRSKRINAIKQCQQNLKEEKHEASENMNSTQSDCSFSDKSIERLRQEKIELLSLLVREEVIQKSINIATQQMEQWLSGCKNTQMSEESRIESLGKLTNIAQQLKQIKSDAMDPQNQSPGSKRNILVNGLIAIGVRYNSHELKSRIKMIMIEELKKMVPKIDMLDRDDITQVIDPVIDQLLKHDEPKSPDNISRIIEGVLAQLDDRSKNMKVKSESESKQEPTDPEPSTSRTQSSNPQTNKSGMDGKPHSGSRSADQDSTSSFNGYGLKQLELVRRGCTIS
ncbi:hypothetical protein NEHOM01_1486 [Nematocida homosporus]|uniref:uncharacterized protein n=1 Tax=Nematocida homosporus TaxID=1912981 RepID=UPI00221FA9CD|nr:uncharacterized protein NEHOM01_1486 [Nematocida homosporus]KAI5186453.1 hypothetical protein NEHOM01_1486 [Nematocida homosporus]